VPVAEQREVDGVPRIGSPLAVGRWRSFSARYSKAAAAGFTLDLQSHLFYKVEMGDYPGAFEQLVLLALLRLGPDAYGMTVRREIEARTGRAVAVGAVYATLDRLQRKGLVSCHDGADAPPERGGRARRYFRIEPAGRRALDDALASVDRMRADLPIRAESPT
jgi:PadR family transcriptional regulator PadR